EVNAKIANASLSQETENKTIKSEHVVRVIGGNITTYKDEPEWIKSLDDFRTWKIIEYDEICPIFDLLDSKLRKEVLEALGQRILA
ncbi:19731_t:CDS:1, partial [Racocetra fulgida]